MRPQKTKAPTVGAAGALNKSQLPKQFSSKSTATAAQRDRIIALLRMRPHNGYELRRAGCYQAPTRIWELIHRFGFHIDSSRVTVVDRDGFTHPGVALYALISEPGAAIPATQPKVPSVAPSGATEEAA